MPDDRREVVVTDIKIPFLSLLVLMIKWGIAAIPAFIILWFMTMIGMMLFWSIMGGVGGVGWMMGGPWQMR